MSSAPKLRDSEADSGGSPKGYRVLDSALTLTVVGGLLMLSAIALLQGLPVRWWLAVLIAQAATLAGLLMLGLKYRWTTARLREQRSALRESEARLNWALWGSGDGLWFWDLDDGQIHSMGTGRFIGKQTWTELAESVWREQVVHRDDRTRVFSALEEHLHGRSEAYDAEYRARTASGDWVWIRARGRVVARDSEGQPQRMAGTYRVIEEERAREEERRISVEIIRLMSEAVTVTSPEFRFTYVNPAFTRITGYAAEDVIGEDAALLNSSKTSAESIAALRQRLEHSGEWNGEMWQRQKNGRDFLAAIEIREVKDASGTRSHFLAVLEDITERKRAEQTLRYLASYDVLTGLPNRTLLVSRLHHALARARRSQLRLALLFIDLDRFKHINDSLGHAAGDELLKQVANRIAAVTGDKERTARLGGDEFTVFIPEVYDIEQVQHAADNLIDAFAAPISMRDQDLTISPSIGIALYPDHGHSVDELLKNADAAMYQAKRRGRNISQIYSVELASGSLQRTKIEAGLRRALDRDEFRLVFQPKVDLGDRRIVGVEALLRWNSAELGEVGPAEFIPVAEETGMILAIGEWVLRSAVEHLAHWREDPALNRIHMAVNVSAAQTPRGDFSGLVQSVLHSHDVPAELLELEITESVLMSDPLQSGLLASDLRKAGVRICIDDFGTGYSSLSYLQRLSIDRLKIDQSFVHAIDGPGDGGVLASTMILMAHSMGLTVVAEGVDSIDQLRYLESESCDEIQGYLVSEPLEAEQCLRFLHQHRDGWRLDR